MDLPGYGDQATWPACTGHPNDPRTDSREADARDAWECDKPYATKIGEDAIEEILYSLQHGDPTTAKHDLLKAIDAAWEQYKNENANEPNYETDD